MARFILKYRTYNYVNKNPVIDKVRTVLQDEGMYAKKKRRLIHELSGVGIGTMEGWFEGDTRNPRHETIAAVMSAIGYEEQFVKTRDIDEEKELQAARKWREQQIALREKARENETAGKTNGARAGKKRKS